MEISGAVGGSVEIGAGCQLGRRENDGIVGCQLQRQARQSPFLLIARCDHEGPLARQPSSKC